MHNILKVEAKAATGEGDIAGFQATCSCGYIIRHTFEGSCIADANAHADYMNAKEGK